MPTYSFLSMSVAVKAGMCLRTHSCVYVCSRQGGYVPTYSFLSMSVAVKAGMCLHTHSCVY